MTEPTRCPRCDALLSPDAPAGLCPRCLVQAGFESQPEEARTVLREGASRLDAGNSGPAARFETPSVSELAAALPQLEILELLGTGGMGVVYKARQRGLDRLVAVKVLPADRNRGAGFAERFTREARALARLNHPHIVAIHDFGQAGNLYYFVMELIDGVNLRQAMQAGQLQSQQALSLIPQICDALQYAHDEGIVHRDIKPENILLDRKGRIKIADFGLSKLVGGESAAPESLTGTHQVMGTMRYMAPEQMHATRSVDHRADIYSLGVVFYEMLTGELPMGRFAPPSEKASVDQRLDEVVLRTLEQEPQRRYQRASEVKTDVEAISRTAISPAPKRQDSATHGVSPEIVDGARLCRVALWGAIWAPFFFLMATGMIVVTDRVSSESGTHDPAYWQFLLGLILVPLGSLAPFGTTILGAIAIPRIKRSAGRLYGLRLAFADAILFPMLTLFILILFLISEALRAMFPIPFPVAVVPAALVSASLCGAAGYLLWRAVMGIETKPTIPREFPRPVA